MSDMDKLIEIHTVKPDNSKYAQLTVDKNKSDMEEESEEESEEEPVQQKIEEHDVNEDKTENENKSNVKTDLGSMPKLSDIY
jgi:hypothetical protein